MSKKGHATGHRSFSLSDTVRSLFQTPFVFFFRCRSFVRSLIKNGRSFVHNLSLRSLVRSFISFTKNQKNAVRSFAFVRTH